MDGNWNTYSCTHKEANNYWSVDLGTAANIDHLDIKNIYALSDGEWSLWKNLGLNDISKTFKTKNAYDLFFCEKK